MSGAPSLTRLRTDDRGREEDLSREVADFRRGRGVVARIVDISGLSGRGKGGRALFRNFESSGLRRNEGRGVLRTAGAETGAASESVKAGRSRKSIEEMESLAPCRLLNEEGMPRSKTFSSSV